MFETIPLTLINSALILGIVMVLIAWPAVKEKTRELKAETQRMREAMAKEGLQNLAAPRPMWDSDVMKQMSLGESGFERKTKRTRKREFLDEMNLVVPWAELVSLIAPHAPAPGAKGGRPPFAVETMLRIHFLQQWFNLSDPAMEEALYDMALFRQFVGLDATEEILPDESTILRFRHLLEVHNLSLQVLATVNATLVAKGLLLKSGTVVDATLIAAPSSTKNSSGERDPEMHQTKKGNQWHFGMKALIGVDADSGLVPRWWAQRRAQ